MEVKKKERIPRTPNFNMTFEEKNNFIVWISY